MPESPDFSSEHHTKTEKSGNSGKWLKRQTSATKRQYNTVGKVLDALQGDCCTFGLNSGCFSDFLHLRVLGLFVYIRNVRFEYITP